MSRVKAKATVPLNVSRQSEKLAVHEALKKRPAAAPRHPTKRTPFSLKREGKMVTGGVKRAIYKAVCKRPANAG